MSKHLGQSAYLSLIRNGTVSLDDIKDDTAVFLSLHMQEECDDNYDQDIFSLCNDLYSKGCFIIADISKNTLKQLDVDIDTLVDRYHLGALRIDYGFSLQEIMEIARKHRVVLNASTMSIEDMVKVKECGRIVAMHNFYPRKETGLDEDRFLEINRELKKNGIEVMAFIPGKIKRGPLYEGLVTLEKQRYQNAYVSYVEMIRRFDVDQVYLSEPGIDDKDLERIRLFNERDLICLSVDIADEYRYLLDRPFTNRIDSPNGLIRILESREYSRSTDRMIKPSNCIKRFAGSITIDNELYKRYCGEIQIMKRDYPQDEKVNVIGKVKADNLELLKLIDRNVSFMLTDQD